MKVFIIATDFGAMVGYIFAVLFPEKLAGIITLGIPYMSPQALLQLQTLPEGFYIRRWQVYTLISYLFDSLNPTT